LPGKRGVLPLGYMLPLKIPERCYSILAEPEHVPDSTCQTQSISGKVDLRDATLIFGNG